MSSHVFKVYDGYSIDPTDGYSFQTGWIPVKDEFAYSISVRFFDGTPSGTLQLNSSNEDSISSPLGGTTGLYGSVLTAANGEQPRYNGLDSTPITTPVTSVTTISDAGTTTYNVQQPGYRWVQVQYIASSGTCSCDIWCHRKRAGGAW